MLRIFIQSTTSLITMEQVSLNKFHRIELTILYKMIFFSKIRCFKGYFLKENLKKPPIFVQSYPITVFGLISNWIKNKSKMPKLTKAHNRWCAIFSIYIESHQYWVNIDSIIKIDWQSINIRNVTEFNIIINTNWNQIFSDVSIYLKNFTVFLD